MDDNQRKTFLETRLRNLKRKYARLIQHSELTDEALKTQNEISKTETILSAMT